jgi:uncharacterized protein
MSVRIKALPEAVRVTEEIPFVGHAMVRAMHARTIEITTEGHLTARGDCIIGVAAARGAAGLSTPMKKALGSDDARVRFTIVAPECEFSFHANGSKDLTFESATDVVIRTSEFVCGRTIAIKAESSAREIPRDLVRTLRSPGAAGLLRIEVYA